MKFAREDELHEPCSTLMYMIFFLHTTCVASRCICTHKPANLIAASPVKIACQTTVSLDRICQGTPNYVDICVFTHIWWILRSSLWVAALPAVSGRSMSVWCCIHSHSGNRKCQEYRDKTCLRATQKWLIWEFNDPLTWVHDSPNRIHVQTLVWKLFKLLNWVINTCSSFPVMVLSKMKLIQGMS